MDRKSDELILQGLRQGDCKAFDELYMRYAPRVEAFACCMLKSRSEAEDLAHDIFLKIWENRQSIGHIRSLGNYLFRMTKNAVFDRFEHKSVQVRYERQCLATGDFLSDDVAAKIASEDLLMIVELAVERMPEQPSEPLRTAVSSGDRPGTGDHYQNGGIPHPHGARRTAEDHRRDHRILLTFRSFMRPIRSSDGDRCFFLRKTVPNGLGMPLVFPSYI